MDQKKYRVVNRNRFDVGVTLYDGRAINIKAGSFAMLTQDEIDYVGSVSELFSRGFLRVDSPEAEAEVLERVGVTVEGNDAFLDDADLRKKLNLSTAKLENWLKGVTDERVLHRLCELAKENDLAASKMRVLEEAVPSFNFEIE